MPEVKYYTANSSLYATNNRFSNDIYAHFKLGLQVVSPLKWFCRAKDS